MWVCSGWVCSWVCACVVGGCVAEWVSDNAVFLRATVQKLQNAWSCNLMYSCSSTQWWCLCIIFVGKKLRVDNFWKVILKTVTLVFEHESCISAANDAKGESISDIEDVGSIKDVCSTCTLKQSLDAATEATAKNASDDSHFACRQWPLNHCAW